MRLRIVVAALATLVLPSVAAAHGTGHQAGFISTVSSIQPPVPGLFLSVVGRDQLLSVRNWSGKPVVLLDGNGHSFLRFAANRVERRQGQRWRTVKVGTSYAWHEPRIHTTGPPPKTDGLVRNWQIRGSADGKAFVIDGFLGYRAPAGTSDGNGAQWAVPVAVAAGAIALAALALTHRRRRGESEAS
jgi:hypothetical protein